VQFVNELAHQKVVPYEYHTPVWEQGIEYTLKLSDVKVPSALSVSEETQSLV
jgi:hypothetical protein